MAVVSGWLWLLPAVVVAAGVALVVWPYPTRDWRAGQPDADPEPPEDVQTAMRAVQVPATWRRLKNPDKESE